jgi:hypothetical protein
VHVVGQHSSAKQANRAPLARARHRALEIDAGKSIETPNAVPGVPGDVRVHLEGAVVRHRRALGLN